MPEREFFSFRFAIPGYILILFIIAINYVPLLRIFETSEAGEVFGAFLAFLSLFSGSALGFLISQFSWYRFDSKGRIFGIKRCKKATNAFIERLEDRTGQKIVIPDINPEKRKVLLDLSHILDYIILTTQGGKGKERAEDRLWSYAERKWDMYHVFSSTRLALILGFGLGTTFRIYYELFIFGTFQLLQDSALSDKVALPEFWAYSFLLLSFVILVILIQTVRHNVEGEYCDTLEFIVRNCEPCAQDMRRAFPEYFEKVKENTSGRSEEKRS